MLKLFLPQATLEEWMLADKADIRDDKLLVPAENASFPVTGAVRFLRTVSGEDAKLLVRKVKTSAQLAELGAEHMADSVILGEDAYEVVPGYLAEIPLPSAAVEKKKPTAETDLLAQFLLNKL